MRLAPTFPTLRLRFACSTPLKYGANAAAQFDDPDWPRFVRITDITDDGRLKDETFRSLPPEEAEPYLLDDGDVLLARSGSIGRSFIYRPEWGTVCHAGYLIRARLSQQFDPKFVYWALNSASYWAWIEGIAIRSTIQNVSAEKYADYPVPAPPLETQKRIAAFLDEKTAQIDGLISRKQALLARLAEKRQAIITQAVTKGLNPAAPMKDSGIDWLGQIPAHWKVRPLKRMVSIWGRIGFRGYTVNDIVSEGEGALSLSPSNIFDDRINYDTKTYISWEKYHESPEIKVRADDILFVKTGSTIGKVCHVAERPEPMTVNPQVVVLKVHSAHSPFLSAAMSSVYFQHQVKGCIFGGSTPAMTQYNLGSLAIVTPPIEEQQSISDYLSKADNEHVAATSSVERSIRLLTEYRAALISSAVTGQIDGLQ